MNVLMSIVKNEDDIIELFVRHHCKTFDHLFIVNHNSLDNTEVILTNLKSEGLPLTVIKENSFYHSQGETITKLSHDIKNSFKTLTVLDADEFFIGDIEMAKAELFSPQYTLGLKWHNYVLTEDSDELNILDKIKYKVNHADYNQHKTLVLRESFNYDVYYLEGCHELYFKDSPIQLISSKHAHLAHFPIRSKNQFMKKALVNWLFKLSNPKNITKPEWSHWKKFFDLAKENKDLDLKELSASYSLKPESGIIFDPIINNIELKYTSTNSNYFDLFCKSAEEIAFNLSKFI